MRLLGGRRRLLRYAIPSRFRNSFVLWDFVCCVIFGLCGFCFKVAYLLFVKKFRSWIGYLFEDYIDYRLPLWDYKMRWRKQRLEPTKPLRRSKLRLWRRKEQRTVNCEKLS